MLNGIHKILAKHNLEQACPTKKFQTKKVRRWLADATTQPSHRSVLNSTHLRRVVVPSYRLSKAAGPRHQASSFGGMCSLATGIRLPITCSASRTNPAP